MVYINAINTGADEALLKSMQGQREVDQNELEKAMKSGLVQVQTTVNGKHGTYTRMQWKRPSDLKATDKVIGGKKPADDKQSAKATHVHENAIAMIGLKQYLDGDIGDVGLTADMIDNPDTELASITTAAKTLGIYENGSIIDGDVDPETVDAIMANSTKVNDITNSAAVYENNGNKFINDGGYIYFNKNDQFIQ